MTENAYGTIIPASVPQTYAQAQSVIDTAILVSYFPHIAGVISG